MKEARPTSGKVLQALFNILGDIRGKAFLDLFSGTGRVAGFARERGADPVVAVETLARRAKDIKSLFQGDEGVTILAMDVRRAAGLLRRKNRAFDVIFADPPYGEGWPAVLGPILFPLKDPFSSRGSCGFGTFNKGEDARRGRMEDYRQPRIRRHGPDISLVCRERGRKMKRSINAVYPGSFDPITNGHIYIAERAAALFDEVVVSVLLNPQKKAAFSVEERKAMAREALSHLPNVKVDSFSGLLVDFLRQEQSRIIIRGLRALSDFEYEFQLALMNRQLAPEIETLFIVTEARYSYLSSHAVKEIYQFGGAVHDMVPPGVFRRLRERFPLPRNILP